MMNDVLYADLLDKLSGMSMSQLEHLELSAREAQEERRERFDFLCGELEKYLETLFNEFPNCHIYLTKSPQESVDLMDLILPKNFLEKCKIGD